MARSTAKHNGLRSSAQRLANQTCRADVPEIYSTYATKLLILLECVQTGPFAISDALVLSRSISDRNPLTSYV